MKYENNKQLITAIQHLMIDNDIRQKDISNRTGWSRQTVSNLLACRRDTINVDTLNKLCGSIGYELHIDFIKKSDSQC